MRIRNYICLVLSLILLSTQIEAQSITSRSDYPYPEAEKYIDRILARELPYSKGILGVTWTINNRNLYPAGNLTKVFAEYLIDNSIIKDKVVADIGSSCFAVGVIAAKNGAKEVIGTSITPEAAENARENITYNRAIAHVFDGLGVEPLLPKYKGKVDVIIFGPPWNTISEADFRNKVPEARRAITKLFYDVDDCLMNDVLSKGQLLLKPNGNIYITASLKIMDRIKRICDVNHLTYEIVKQEDIHKDNNVHYILRLIPKK